MSLIVKESDDFDLLSEFDLNELTTCYTCDHSFSWYNEGNHKVICKKYERVGDPGSLDIYPGSLYIVKEGIRHCWESEEIRNDYKKLIAECVSLTKSVK